MGAQTLAAALHDRAALPPPEGHDLATEAAADQGHDVSAPGFKGRSFLFLVGVRLVDADDPAA
jgi:hypothetical protein